MFDFHTHTVFSDGVLIPAELAQRAKNSEYQGVAITDHVDHTNMEWVLDNLLSGVKTLSVHAGLEVYAGVEITHVPPPLIPDLVDRARELGAQLVLVHGETIVEPVERGTNLAAIESGVDILAHPGLISAEEAGLAAENRVLLEISTRKGHSLTNGHVLEMARQNNSGLIMNNDAHEPGDLIPAELRRYIAYGAGMKEEEYLRAEENSRELQQQIIVKKR